MPNAPTKIGTFLETSYYNTSPWRGEGVLREPSSISGEHYRNATLGGNAYVPKRLAIDRLAFFAFQLRIVFFKERLQLVRKSEKPIPLLNIKRDRHPL